MDVPRINVKVFEGGKATKEFTKIAFARLPAVGEFIQVGSDMDRDFYRVVTVIHLLADQTGGVMDTDIAAQVYVIPAKWTEEMPRP